MSNQIDYFTPPSAAPDLRSRGTILGWIVRSIAFFVLWILFVGMLVAVFFGCFHNIMWGAIPFAGIGAPLAIALIILLVTWNLRVARRQRASSILVYLEQAVRLNFPLPRMLAVAAAAETGMLRRRLTDVSDILLAGSPVSTALASCAPEVARRDLRLVQSAERTGHLAPVLRRLVEEDRGIRWRESEHWMLLRLYIPTMLLAIIAVGAFLPTYILPRFEKLLRDVGAQPHPLADVADIFRADSPILLAFAVILAVYFGMQLVEILLPWRRRLNPLRWLRDRLAWWTPLLGRAASARALADVCQRLGDAISAGYPADRALADAADLEMNQVMHRRVARWRDGVTAGLGIAEAARRAKLPPLVAGMLAASLSAPNSAEALRFLARYYTARFSRIAALLRSAIIPATAIALGIIVFLFAIQVFLPILQLMAAEMPGFEVML